jgi:putative spermidine/putrescine transport system ATP-binding protein
MTVAMAGGDPMLTTRARLDAAPMADTLPRKATPPADFCVEIAGVSKRYAGTVAVDNVSFAVRRGAFVTLLGPSGSGKTTILRMIAGFIQPSAGEIHINGRPVAAVPPYKRSIGVVFQSLAIFPHMTVAENVAYPLKCRRFDRRQIPDLVAQYLRLVRLDGFQKRRTNELSGGQRQRVAIARALVYRPDLLLLDEPLAALDKKLREEIQFELRRIQSELGVTTINVTHDQREALVMSDEIVVLDGGRIQQAGPPPAIYRTPANRFVASFIGQTNVIPGTGPGDAADYALRAERIRIARTRRELGTIGVCIAGTVRTVAYEGDRVLYEVGVAELAGAVLRVICGDGPDALAAGEEIVLGWSIDDPVRLGPGTPP